MTTALIACAVLNVGAFFLNLGIVVYAATEHRFPALNVVVGLGNLVLALVCFACYRMAREMNA